MSAELAVGIAAAAFVLMVGIVAGFGAVVFLDSLAIWPRSLHRRPLLARRVAPEPVGVRLWAHQSVIDTEGRWVA